jgi:hypothetical protein
MFGANHGEIGACLLGMWNLPNAIVEATALHHEPPLGEHQELTPLAAVHIANVLEHQLRPTDQDMMVAPIINTPFLNELGLLERLPVWRAAFANRMASTLEPEGESAQVEPSESPALSSTTANQLPGPATVTRTTTSAPPRSAERTSHSAHSRKLWVYGGIAAGAMALLAVWLNTQPDLNEGEPIYARMPVAQQEPAAPVSTPSPELAVAPAPQEAPVAVSKEPPVPPTPTSPATVTTNGAASPPALEQTAQISHKPTVTNVPPASVARVEKAQAAFRLNGIIYTSVRPSAIINGETVNVGDQVDGATVVAIGPTTVMLKINGQLKIYHLK